MDEYLKEHWFEETDAIGRKYELEKLEEIKKIYPQSHKYEPNEKWRMFECDIVIPEIMSSVECKADYAGETTLNVCIEVGQDGRKSGLYKTLAKYWLHCDGIKDYFLKTDDIKKLIKEMHDDEMMKFKANPDYIPNLHGIIYQSKFRKNQGNYDKLMDWYLIPKELFKTICLEVKDKGKLTYRNLI
jgi:hypothetical protein